MFWGEGRNSGVSEWGCFGMVVFRNGGVSECHCTPEFWPFPPSCTFIIIPILCSFSVSYLHLHLLSVAAAPLFTCLNTHYCVDISLFKAQPPLVGQLSQAWTATAHHASASAVPELCNHRCPWMWLRAMTLWLWHHHLIEILTHLKVHIFSGFWYFHCISLATRCALRANNLWKPRSSMTGTFKTCFDLEHTSAPVTSPSQSDISWPSYK